jgi:hypothetical protein
MEGNWVAAIILINVISFIWFLFVSVLVLAKLDIIIKNIKKQ